MEANKHSGKGALPSPKDRQKALAEAYGWYQHNIQKVDPLVYELTLGARSGRSVQELLGVALEAIDRMTGLALRRELS